MARSAVQIAISDTSHLTRHRHVTNWIQMNLPLGRFNFAGLRHFWVIPIFGAFVDNPVEIVLPQV